MMATIRPSAPTSTTLIISVLERRGAEARHVEDEALPASSDRGRRHSRDTEVGERPACPRFRHLGRAGFQRSRPDGDRA